jgi:hypothetical protein
MKNFGRTAGLTLASFISALLPAGPSPSHAQQAKVSVPSESLVLIPGAMIGFGTMGPTGYRRLCSPQSVGLYQLRMTWIERLLKLSDAQKPLLNELSARSMEARAAITAACPKEPLETTSVRLAAMEMRLDALSEALKLVRPAYERFYASLDDRQKAVVEAMGRRRSWGL